MITNKQYGEALDKILKICNIPCLSESNASKAAAKLPTNILEAIVGDTVEMSSPYNCWCDWWSTACKKELENRLESILLEQSGC